MVENTKIHNLKNKILSIINKINCFKTDNTPPKPPSNTCFFLMFFAHIVENANHHLKLLRSSIKITNLHHLCGVIGVEKNLNKIYDGRSD